ncbi:MAG: ATP-binding protein [Trichloromonas sp.]|jgi:signal transduction histidine kinase|nr:ATP-binding protein [Trichloromonas sp.]
MRVTLGRKLFLYTGGTLTLVLLMTFLVLERSQARQWEEHLHAQSRAFARFATPELLKLFRGSFEPRRDDALGKVVEFLAVNRDLIGFTLISPGGRVLFQSPRFGPFSDHPWPEPPTPENFSGFSPGAEPRLRTLPWGEGRILELLMPAFGPTGEQVLTVRYLLTYASVDARLAEMRASFARIACLSLLASLPLVALAARRVSRPIQSLTAGARAVARGELDTRLHIANRDEIGGLARAFNHMAENLSLSRDELTAKNRELIEANENLRQVQEQLIRSERLAAIGQLAAGVSHEIDNPVGIILGYAELLLDDLDEADPRRDDVLAIIAECRRCRRITGGLLGLARGGAVRRESLRLDELAEATVASLRPQKLFRQVPILIQPPPQPLEVFADPDQLRQVLVNLLLNAAQAMGGAGEVVLTLSRDGERIELTVDDSGPGVPVELRERIFDPFFSSKGSGEGTGLGLSLCRKLMEEQGGSLFVADSPVGGARFGLLLPAASGEKSFDKSGDAS